MKIQMGSVTPSPEVCVRCKGRLWCGPKCFILERYEKRQWAVHSVQKRELQSESPPGVFVGWYGYPKITLSPMAPALSPKDSWMTDDTDKWFGLSSEKIIEFRENLVRGSMPVEVHKASDPSYQVSEIQETLMAKKSVDIEMKLKSIPTARGLSFSDFHAPMGPSADLSEFRMTENPSINPKIDYLVSDTDVKAKDAMVELFDAEVGVNQLHKILSAGMLGVKKNRKFVPTRFAITAIDSNLSEYFIDEKIKYYPHIQEFELYSSNYLENYFYILLVPKEWSYELMEVWKPGASWNIESKEPTFMTDYEFYAGRKDYAENTAGGYYAVRIAIAEQLEKRKKQATALVFREIGDAGTPALGVWKCRNTVRAALDKKPLTFSTVNLALDYIATKLTVPIKYYKKNSKILDVLAHQRTLLDFS
ncbi:MAG: hypothetical protein AABW99_00545 [archaeon]